jgi:tRNA(Ile)-lysidine synthase
MTDTMAEAEQTALAAEEPVERFKRDLQGLVAPDGRLGLAVSGGPDSLALLLLVAEARPGLVEAATVDHALRKGSRAEADMVAALCEKLGVPHTILTVEWPDGKPEAAIQERARMARYKLLSGWAEDKGLAALLTGHHVDDQAETFFMRLSRGAGVKGLAGMRRLVRAPGSEVALVRPLLGWRRSELEEICKAASVIPAADPSNDDEQFERVRVRKALADSEWLDARSVALSAANLGQADAALHWATTQEWKRGVKGGPAAIVYAPVDAPREIRRRIARRAVLKLASEGRGADLRGRELDRLLAVLTKGGKATIRGVLCAGGKQWRFAKAPPRKR